MADAACSAVQLSQRRRRGRQIPFVEGEEISVNDDLMSLDAETPEEQLILLDGLRKAGEQRR